MVHLVKRNTAILTSKVGCIRSGGISSSKMSLLTRSHFVWGQLIEIKCAAINSTNTVFLQFKLYSTTWASLENMLPQ